MTNENKISEVKELFEKYGIKENTLLYKTVESVIEDLILQNKELSTSLQEKEKEIEQCKVIDRLHVKRWTERNEQLQSDLASAIKEIIKLNELSTSDGRLIAVQQLKISKLEQEIEELKEERDRLQESLLDVAKKSCDRIKELEDGIKQINELCGTVNLSSYNQMKEAITGSVDISNNLLNQTTETSAELEGKKGEGE